MAGEDPRRVSTGTFSAWATITRSSTVAVKLPDASRLTVDWETPRAAATHPWVMLDRTRACFIVSPTGARAGAGPHNGSCWFMVGGARRPAVRPRTGAAVPRRRSSGAPCLAAGRLVGHQRRLPLTHARAASGSPVRRVEGHLPTLIDQMARWGRGSRPTVPS